MYAWWEEEQQGNGQSWELKDPAVLQLLTKLQSLAFGTGVIVHNLIKVGERLLRI
jgi:hypothetical protein